MANHLPIYTRSTDEYQEGVEKFIEFAFAKSAEHSRILCPCLGNKKYLIIWFLMGSLLATHHGLIVGRAYGNPIQLSTQAHNVKVTMLAVIK